MGSLAAGYRSFRICPNLSLRSVIDRGSKRVSRSSWSRGILLAPQATGGKPDLRAPARAGLGIGVSLLRPLLAVPSG